MEQKDAVSTQNGRNAFNREHPPIVNEKQDHSIGQFESTMGGELLPDEHLTEEEKIAAVSFALSTQRSTLDA